MIAYRSVELFRWLALRATLHLERHVQTIIENLVEPCQDGEIFCYTPGAEVDTTTEFSIT